MAFLPLGYLLPAIVLAVTAVIAYYIICYLTSPLKDIPGPFVAKFSSIWRVYDYYHLISPETQKKLHAKHGLAVRLSPNLVSLNDPSMIPIIYNARGTFRKVGIPSMSGSSSKGNWMTPGSASRLKLCR